MQFNIRVDGCCDVKQRLRRFKPLLWHWNQHPNQFWYCCRAVIQFGHVHWFPKYTECSRVAFSFIHWAGYSSCSRLLYKHFYTSMLTPDGSLLKGKKRSTRWFTSRSAKPSAAPSFRLYLCNIWMNHGWWSGKCPAASCLNCTGKQTSIRGQ